MERGCAEVQLTSSVASSGLVHTHPTLLLLHLSTARKGEDIPKPGAVKTSAGDLTLELYAHLFNNHNLALMGKYTQPGKTVQSAGSVYTAAGVYFSCILSFSKVLRQRFRAGSRYGRNHRPHTNCICAHMKVRRRSLRFIIKRVTRMFPTEIDEQDLHICRGVRSVGILLRSSAARCFHFVWLPSQPPPPFCWRVPRTATVELFGGLFSSKNQSICSSNYVYTTPTI